MTITSIYQLLRQIVQKFDMAKYQARVDEFYELMKLKDGSDWKHPVLEGLSDELLPSRISDSDLLSLLEQSAENLSSNQYLIDFLEKIEGEKVKSSINAPDDEIETVLFDTLAYTFMLEKLTAACLNNYEVMDALYQTLKKERDEKKAFKNLPLFHKIKLISVELPIKTYINCFKTSRVKPTSGGTAVAINIWEATWTDFKSGVKGNAYTGKVLALNKCGRKVPEQSTGAGPSSFSDDGKLILRKYPLGKLWTDLYQTWNMAFVTRFKDYPFILPKLIIPSVSGYVQQPDEYIYRRAIALYLYLNFASFDMTQKSERTEEQIDWRSTYLSGTWSECNRKSTDDYLAKLKRARSSKVSLATEEPA